MIPYDKDSGLDLTPEQFELEVKKIIETLGSKLTNFESKHLEKIQGMDGEYEVDITARFEAFGSNFLVLIECKKYKSPVKRDVVQVLSDRIHSTGAHKGMIFTTSGFQRGAIEYAQKHGISLVQFTKGGISYKTRSAFQDASPSPWLNLPGVEGWVISENEGRLTLACLEANKSANMLKIKF